MLDHAEDLLLVFNLDEGGKPDAFVEVNDRASILLGYPKDKLLATPPVELIVPPLRRQWLDAVERLRQTRYAAMDVLIASGNGATIPFQISMYLCTVHKQNSVICVARDTRERRQREKFIEALADLGQKMSAASTPREVAQVTLETADNLFGWDASFLNIVPDDRRRVYPVIHYDVVDGVKKEVIAPPDDLQLSVMARRALDEGPQIVLRTLDEAPVVSEWKPFGDTSRRSVSLVYIPIRKRGRGVGVLSIQSYTHNAYKRSDLYRLQILADHCSGALERTFVEDRLHKQEYLTFRISELGKNLTAAPTCKEMAMVILDTAEEIFGWDAGYMHLWNKDESRVYPVIHVDTVDGKKQIVDIDEEPIEPTEENLFADGPFLVLRDFDPNESEIPTTMFGDKTRRSLSLMFTPIRKGEKDVGILSIQSYKQYAYDDEDLKTLQILANHCGSILDRTLAEEELQRSEEKLRLITEQIPAVLWTTDAELYLTQFLGRGLSRLNIDPRKRVGKSLSEFFETDDTDYPPIDLHARALKGESASCELEMMGVYLHLYVEPLRDADGQIIGCVSVAHDITETIKAEEELKRAHDELERRVEERTQELSRSNARLIKEMKERRRAEEERERTLSLLRATFESTTDGILVQNMKGEILNYNQAFLTMWKIPVPILSRQNARLFFQIMYKQLRDPKEFSSRVLDLYTQPEDESFDVLELQDGRIFECFSKPQIIGGKSVGRVWSFRDDTQRKNTEKKLAHSESIYREAIENAAGVPYQMYYVEEDGKLKHKYDFIGEGFEALFGFPASKASLERLKEAVQETGILTSDVPRNPSDYVRAFRDGEVSTFRVDIRIKTPQGEEKWISDCSVPRIDEKTGKVIGSLGIMQDITERKHAEERVRLHQEQLIQADKMVALGILVSGVAHEINNPNNFIMLNTPMLIEVWDSIVPVLEQYYKDHGDFIMGGLNYSEMRDNVPVLYSGILEGSKRIKTIVQELKSFAQQKPSDMKETVDINAIVQSAITLLSAMIKNSTRHFDVEYGDKLPGLKGNFQQLEQVVINLIQNACQALPDASRAVTLITRFDSDSECVIMEVRDEGEGIPSDQIKYIMDPFFTTKRDKGGTGLGLSISSTIINDHGGRLEYDSTPGEGTTVRMIIPVTRDDTPEKEVVVQS